MITTTLAVLALTPVAYVFTPTTSHEFTLQVKMEGFLPLLGGNEGTAQVEMGVKVAGLEGAGENLKATNEIIRSDFLFNGAKLPLTVKNVQDFFPKTTVTLSPGGKILNNSAPDRALPVRLPGLHVRRFPDITYLPLEFPKDGIAVGESWTFTKDFGDSPITYTATPREITDAIATIDVKVAQNYTVYENDALEVVKDPDDAVAKVATTMTGEGVVVFDRKAGVPNRVRMVNTALSKVTEVAASGKSSERKLVSTLTVTRKGAPAEAPAQVAPAEKPPVRTWRFDPVGAWNRTTQWFGEQAETLGSWVQMGRMALIVMASQVPGGQMIVNLLTGRS